MELSVITHIEVDRSPGMVWVVAAFNQEKALVGAFSVIMNLRMELFEALIETLQPGPRHPVI